MACLAVVQAITFEQVVETESVVKGEILDKMSSQMAR